MQHVRRFPAARPAQILTTFAWILTTIFIFLDFFITYECIKKPDYHRISAGIWVPCANTLIMRVLCQCPTCEKVLPAKAGIQQDS